ncbi:hypothetical protein F66182_2565 [Fusarium sp. NRRL 66182]|nr:hypothetical protein F66182_2565 [Fusarium sp. NRRL 66182]
MQAIADTPLQLEIDTAWQATFNYGPYTSLPMLSYVLDRLGVQHAQLMQTPNLVDDERKKELMAILDKTTEEDLLIAPLFDCWYQPPGRCTSFSLRTANQLVEQKPEAFKFLFYDFARHRVARCIKTCTLMDSSSQEGAIILKSGTWEGSETDDAHIWSWEPKDAAGKEAGGWFRNIKKPVEHIERHKAMVACFKQLVGDKRGLPALIYFRYFTNKKALFQGLMSWKLTGDAKKKEFEDTGNPIKDDDADDAEAAKLRGLHLTWSIGKQGGNEKSSTRRFVIQWEVPGSSEQTRQDSLNKVKEYLDNCCVGPTITKVQWESIKSEHDKFWDAACTLWGHPQVTHTPQDRS